MAERIIRKPDRNRARANMPDYAEAHRSLGWEQFRAWLDYLPDGGLNIAHEAVDRHVADGHGAREALRWLGRSGERQSFSYADLQRETGRFARLLSELEPGP